ncbi:hypothetical protein CHS0354_024568 [Potamilus streckersoni]|uniref:Uncharacterized protein n=1 Tax=Potamilus streckersoni TaxID=2493646 RepID=A0AAE0VPA8_9BIVA|nr:hypothetical protein CHS0354_024568 [Potamilus streckersoni]
MTRIFLIFDVLIFAADATLDFILDGSEGLVYFAFSPTLTLFSIFIQANVPSLDVGKHLFDAGLGDEKTNVCRCTEGRIFDKWADDCCWNAQRTLSSCRTDSHDDFEECSSPSKGKLHADSNLPACMCKYTLIPRRYERSDDKATIIQQGNLCFHI